MVVIQKEGRISFPVSKYLIQRSRLADDNDNIVYDNVNVIIIE